MKYHDCIDFSDGRDIVRYCTFHMRIDGLRDVDILTDSQSELKQELDHLETIYDHRKPSKRITHKFMRCLVSELDPPADHVKPVLIRTDWINLPTSRDTLRVWTFTGCYTVWDAHDLDRYCHLLRLTYLGRKEIKSITRPFMEWVINHKGYTYGRS